MTSAFGTYKQINNSNSPSAAD